MKRLFVLMLLLLFIVACKEELRPEPIEEEDIVEPVAEAVESMVQDTEEDIVEPVAEAVESMVQDTEEDMAETEDNAAEMQTVETSPKVEENDSEDQTETTQTETSTNGEQETNESQTVTTDQMTESNTQPIEIGIIIKDNQFQPEVETVKVNTKVTWVNLDEGVHTVSGSTFDSGTLGKGDDFSHVFNEKGEFEYICNIHPGMKGIIAVD